MLTFGQRLRALRMEKGYTQAQLADMLGIAASTVGMYEQDRREPDGKMLLEIGRVFSVSADYLLSRKDNEPCEIEEALSGFRGRLKESGGLMFKGIPLNEKDTEKLFDAMLIAANIMLKNKEDNGRDNE